MSNSVKNVILILALSAVAVMVVGLFVYDFIPSGLSVSEANKYETTATTTEALSGATEAQKLLTEQKQSTSSTAGSKTPVKTNIVLKEYDVSKTDLAFYTQAGSYVKGKPDPFSEYKEEESSGEGNAAVNPGSSTSTNTVATPADGTYYNSTYKK